MSQASPALIQLAIAVAGGLAFFVVAMLLKLGLPLAIDPALSLLRPVFAALDRLLAVRVAGLIGLDERQTVRRWARLLAAFVLAAAAGALLPPAVATPVLLLGLTAVVAVFRRWEWDEEDRHHGLNPEARRFPGDEDYNDEMLAALAAVFTLGSLLIWRLTGLHIFRDEPGAGLTGHLLYLVSEALEAVPIIGNYVVFGFENPSHVKAVLPAGGWVVFLLRMALDLLVIAGLIKAVEVGGRIARGQDLRREDGVIARGNPAEAAGAIRRLGDFLNRGNVTAGERLQALAMPPEGVSRPALTRLLSAATLQAAALHGAPNGALLMGFVRDAYLDILEAPDLPEDRQAVLYTLLGQAQALASGNLYGDRRVAALNEAIEYSRKGFRLALDGQDPGLGMLEAEPPTRRDALAIPQAAFALGQLILGNIVWLRAEDVAQAYVQAEVFARDGLMRLPEGQGAELRVRLLQVLSAALIGLHLKAPSEGSYERAAAALADFEAAFSLSRATPLEQAMLMTSLANQLRELGAPLGADREAAWRRAIQILRDARAKLEGVREKTALREVAGNNLRASLAALLRDTGAATARPDGSSLLAEGLDLLWALAQEADPNTQRDRWLSSNGELAVGWYQLYQRETDAQAATTYLQKASAAQHVLLDAQDPAVDGKSWSVAAVQLTHIDLKLGERTGNLALLRDTLALARRALDICRSLDEPVGIASAERYIAELQAAIASLETQHG